MKIYNCIDCKIETQKEGIVAIGYFDAFHLGHRYLLEKLVKIAKEKGKKSFVITYKNLVKKNFDNKGLVSLNFKIDEIRKIGVNNLILIDYDENFSNLKPNDFLQRLSRNFRINEFIIGKDFSFGKDRAGNIETLLQNNFKIEIIEPFTIDNKYISASLIRTLILDGEIEQANNLLGRLFSIDGIVRKGKQLGRKLGFPTMNIKNESILYPLEGSYATITSIKDKKYYSMTYIGDQLIESNLFDYNIFHYNFKIKVDFLRKIRDNRSFDNLDELKSQLSADRTVVKKYFMSNYDDMTG